jgi:gas vesicle structural protein
MGENSRELKSTFGGAHIAGTGNVRGPRDAKFLQMNPHDQVVLSEVLDRVLNKGAVVAGEVVISVAGIDLLYLGLNVLLASFDTARTALQSAQTRVHAR